MEQSGPEILYKFLRPQAGLRLGSGALRFSQFAALNDPLEFLTSTTESELTENINQLFLDEFNNFGMEQRVLSQVGPRYDAKLAELGLPEPLSVELKHREPAFLAALLPWLRQQLLGIQNELFPAVAASFANKLIAGVRKGEITIFSATEIWNSPPMWAHYADEWRGRVLGFDPRTMFSKVKNELVERAVPQKIRYSDTIPQIIVHAESTLEILTNKTADWAYEREWRYVDASPEYGPDVLEDGTRLHLRQFSPAAIREVIFGSKCGVVLREQIKSTLAQLGCAPEYFEVTVEASSQGLARRSCKV